MNTQTNEENLYHYKECGLDNVYIAGGFKEIDSPYGKQVRIVDIEGLHKAIAEILVRKKAKLTGTEFRFLRTELGLSQSAVGALCGTKERRVRDWESSDAIDDPADAIIRFVYEQRFINRAAQFEDIVTHIKALQEADKKVHELKLGMINGGWKAEACLAA